MSDNIIFMGTSKFAVPILEKISESKFKISVVYTQSPKKSNRGMKGSVGGAFKVSVMMFQ